MNTPSPAAILASASLPFMDYLWTPWRYAYVSTAEKASSCIFCDLPKINDADALIVYRGQDCFVILNSFPYSPGHVMVVPFAHVDQLQSLPTETAHEMIDLTKKMEAVLRKLYSPDGINIGMNIGKAAGAGVAGHIHMHALPRWVADANFMSVVAETRVLPESLETTYRKIKTAWAASE
jgi:ATP adenylyltransferase